MSLLDTPVSVIGYAATLTHRAFGFSITKYRSESVVYIAQVTHTQDNVKHTVTVTIADMEDKNFLVGIINEPGSLISSTTVRYSDYFKDIKLPITTDHLDEYITSNNNKNFATFYQLLSLEKSPNKAQEEPNSQTNKLYEEAIFPSVKSKGYVSEISKPQKEIINTWFGYTPTLGLDKPLATTKPLPEPINKFDDEYEATISSQPQQRIDPLRIPSIGDSDRDPLGGRTPEMKPYLDPSFQTPSGMIPDKNHPIFQNPHSGFPGSGVRGGLNMGPPGSRYDDPFGNDVNDESVGMGLPMGSLRGDFNGRGPSGRSQRGSGGFPGGGFI
ncbi:hypothetical protein WICPIJ_001204 [Wickerhamomyces pijperi]|uniref:PI31 proteasome regulator C-terminal domain-containing protein n=1 Tax=Wickerhamomyces pijperi TaxID=599730 RepID=A0A9P8TR13_WICPI|nr:hypothetical protein WICPIJ_001204 [Wickerhamomyces pijperi]